MPAMQAAIEARTGERPTEYLVAGGYVTLETLEEATAAGTTVYASVPRRNGCARGRPCS